MLGISKVETATELRAGKLEAERKSLRVGTEGGLGVQGSSQGGGASIPRCFCSQKPGVGGGNVTTGDQHLTKQTKVVRLFFCHESGNPKAPTACEQLHPTFMWNFISVSKALFLEQFCRCGN